MIIKKSESNFDLPPEGEHVATLMEVQDLGELPNNFKPGETAHYMRLVWKLKGIDVRQFQKVKVSTHPSSTFYDIATQLLGNFPAGDIDTNSLVGKSLYMTTAHTQSQDGRIWSNVKDVRPIKFKGRTLPRPEELGMEPVTVSAPRGPAKEDPITDEDVPF